MLKCPVNPQECAVRKLLVHDTVGILMNGNSNLLTGCGIYQDSSSREGTEIDPYCILVHFNMFMNNLFLLSVVCIFAMLAQVMPVKQVPVNFFWICQCC